jgi:hypothetical protein
MVGVCCRKNSFTRSLSLRWTRIQASKMCGGTLGMGPVCGAELERDFRAQFTASSRSGLSVWPHVVLVLEETLGPGDG